MTVTAIGNFPDCRKIALLARAICPINAKKKKAYTVARDSICLLISGYLDLDI
jgi:hypothetical protein